MAVLIPCWAIDSDHPSHLVPFSLFLLLAICLLIREKGYEANHKSIPFRTYKAEAGIFSESQSQSPNQPQLD